MSFNAEFRNGISQLSWSPLRSGLLASIGRDSPTFKLWDIQESTAKEYVSSTLLRNDPSSLQTSAGGGPGGGGGVGSSGVPSGAVSAGPSSTLPTLPSGAAGDTMFGDPSAARGGDNVSAGSVTGGPGAGLPSLGPLVSGGSRLDSGPFSAGSNSSSGMYGSGGGFVGSGSDAGIGSIGSAKREGEGSDGGRHEEWRTAPTLWKTRTVKPDSQYIQGFTWIPIASVDDFSHRVITAHARESQFIITHLSVTYKVAFSPTGSMAVTGGKAIMLVPVDNPQRGLSDSAYTEANLSSAPAASRRLSRSKSGSSATAIPIPVDMGVSFDIGSPVESVRSGDRMAVEGSFTLRKDVSVVMRERAAAGYSMDSERNQTMLADEPQLCQLWAWIDHCKRLSIKGQAKINDKDFATQGIYAIIQEMAVSAAYRRRAYPGQAPSPTAGPPGLDSSDHIPFVSYTNAHRKLALLICGWGFHTELPEEQTLEDILRRMEMEGQYEKAAGWALFHSSSLTRAIKALNASKNERLKLVATALAGYSSTRTSDDASSLWQDLCRSLSAELTDPYLRAMFALIASNGDWTAVLQEKGLSIKDRIGVALR
ncbi:hypothetical protein BDK51DRAFT_28702, partial [Blyttiomyces helicus]